MGQAAFLIVAGTVLSRIFGLVRETVIAYQFGATALPAVRDAARCSPIKWNILQVYVSHSMEAVKKPANGRSGWSTAIRAEGEAGLAVV